MRIEQEWEGYVVDIGLSEFVARLVDLTAGSSHEEEEAIIPLAQVSDHDAARLHLGSIFRCTLTMPPDGSGLQCCRPRRP